MKTVIIGFISIVLLVLAFLVLRSILHGAQYAVAAAAGSARSGSFGSVSGTGTGPQLQGPYTIHGTAIMDESHGIPAVPYIQYLNSSNATSTKQLVYMDSRPCAPGAGDFPCAPTYSASQGYPQLSTGQQITATGYLYENRFLITSIK